MGRSLGAQSPCTKYLELDCFLILTEKEELCNGVQAILADTGDLEVIKRGIFCGPQAEPENTIRIKREKKKRNPPNTPKPNPALSPAPLKKDKAPTSNDDSALLCPFSHHLKHPQASLSATVHDKRELPQWVGSP